MRYNGCCIHPCHSLVSKAENTLLLSAFFKRNSQLKLFFWIQTDKIIWLKDERMLRIQFSVAQKAACFVRWLWVSHNSALFKKLKLIKYQFQSKPKPNINHLLFGKSIIIWSSLTYWRNNAQLKYSFCLYLVNLIYYCANWTRFMQILHELSS